MKTTIIVQEDFGSITLFAKHKDAMDLTRVVTANFVMLYIVEIVPTTPIQYFSKHNCRL